MSRSNAEIAEIRIEIEETHQGDPGAGVPTAYRVAVKDLDGGDLGAPRTFNLDPGRA